MSRKAAVGLLALLCVIAASAASAMPVGYAGLDRSTGQDVERATFWAHPYPYGYTWRRPGCWAERRIHTHRGWRWRRVWVCAR